MNQMLATRAIIALTGLFAFLSVADAQYNTKVFELKQAQELYDERGFSQGKSITVDGKLAVSNSNGNVSYSYPISDFKISGFPIQVALNYCGSVAFTTFKEYFPPDRHTGNIYSRWEKFHQNRPAWILGVNGFAVQAISTTPHFHSDFETLTTPRSAFKDEHFVWAIDGYDFNNRMANFQEVGQGYQGIYTDVIRLLRADGSVMELVHMSNTPGADSLHVTGIYHEEAANSPGFAIVEWDTITYWPAHLKDLTSNGNYQKPRKVKYYPGDGLEYVFREWVTPYGMQAYTNRTMPMSNLGGVYSGPTIFYLEELNANGQKLTDFTRSRHYTMLAGTSGTDSTRGRALISEFAGHKFSFGDSWMLVEALGRTTIVKFDKVVVDGRLDSTIAMPIAVNGSASRAAGAMATLAEADVPYKSYLGMVTKIVDSEGRETRFEYEPYTTRYLNHGFVPAPSNQPDSIILRNWRLRQVHEPTARYTIAYHVANEWPASQVLTIDTVNEDKRNVDAGISQTLSGGNINPYSQNNVARRVTKYDKSNRALSTDLYSFAYEVFSPCGQEAGGATYSTRPTTAIRITTDHLSALKDTMSWHYAQRLVACDVPLSPAIYYTELQKVVHRAAGQVTVDSTIYTNPAGRLVLPLTRQRFIDGNGLSGLTRVEHQYYNYTIGTINPYGGDDSLANKYGKGVLLQYTQNNLPSDDQRRLWVDTTVFTHLSYVDTTYVRWIARWDKIASIANYYDKKDEAPFAHITWDEGCTDSTIFGIYHYGLDTTRLVVPPHYNLVKRTSRVDSIGRYLAGTINTYYSRYVNPDSLAIRGRLLNDSIIGRGGISRVLNHRYEYELGIIGQNLPASITNANGSTTRYKYDFKLPELLDTTTHEYDLPTGTIHADDDVRLDTAIRSADQYALWFEQPAAERSLVRTYTSYPSVDTVVQTQLMQRTFYGLAKAIIDPNGWYSKFAYDYNGRLSAAWLPYDFPQGGGRDTMQYDGTETIDILGFTHFNAGNDTLVCSPTNPPYTFNAGYFTYDINERLYAAKFPTVVPDCPGSGSTGKGNAHIQDDANQHIGYYNFDPTYFTGYTGHLNYYIDSSSILKHVANGGLDSMHLQLFVSSITGNCVNLVVEIPEFSFSTTYVLKCTQGGGVETASRKEGNPAILSTPAQDEYFLNVKLASIASQILAKPYGSTLAIKLRVTTSGGEVSFINGDNAEDTRPRLVLKGTFERLSDLADNTLAYTYDDEQLTTAVTAKVDDIRHTESVWAISGMQGDIRRSSALHKFGADYRLNRSDATIVEPGGTQRTDSVSFLYDGLGHKTRVKDQEGDTTATQFDALGRPVKISNADGTSSTVEYSYFLPGGYPTDWGDQNWYGGPTRVRKTISETGIRTLQYFDVFDSLRRQAVDANGLDYLPTSGLRLTTRYNYDVMGRLNTVINPKGDTTRYWYDDFGRVRYKRQPDLGTVSYAYDKVGNVRFSQTQQQSAQKLLTFNQYDDLNRLVVIGEAGIVDNSPPSPGSQDSFGLAFMRRLTDRIDPTKLHLGSSLNGAILTANPTITTTSDSTMPTVWSYAQQVTVTCPIPAQPVLGESTTPVGPFMKHPASSYEPVITYADSANFENAAWYPRFLRTVISYDRMPVRTGPVWSALPDTAQWNAITPKGQVRNLIGREAVVAYREHGGEPFHYVVLSYDERGRVEALLRYTENLGFDAVYYTYNSLNEVTAVRVADPLRQHTTWYGYDRNGRVDSVWTALQAVGSGLGVAPATYPAMIARTQTQRSAADIAYRYTKTGRVDTMFYPPVNVSVDYSYNQRKALEKIAAARSGTGIPPTMVFEQELDYDSSGQVIAQTSRRNPNWPTVAPVVTTQTYGYDNADRLSSWQEGSDTTNYSYDAIGNRLADTLRVTGTNSSHAYNLGAGGSNRLFQMIDLSSTGAVTGMSQYGYNADGATIARTRTNSTAQVTGSEQYSYSYRGLLNRYRTFDPSMPGTPLADWRYRSSASSEREQKRLYTWGSLSTSQGYINHTRPWVYYLLGGTGTELAVYHGLETTDSLCGENGSDRVYMYPVEYNTFGVAYTGTREDLLQIMTRPSGAKEYRITDNLASLRLVVSATGMTHHDYAPWGKSLSSQGTTRRGFNDNEEDVESSLLDLGVRKYDEEAGRFYSIDPLWASDPSRKPYHYSGNDPINFVDPSGLQREQDFFDDDHTKEGGGGGEIPAVPPTGFPMRSYSTEPAGPAEGIAETGTRGGGAETPRLPGGPVRPPSPSVVRNALTGGGEGASIAGGGPTTGSGGPQPQLLNQVNSVESLIGRAGPLKRLSGGTRQGSVQGDGQSIWNAVTRGGTPTRSGGMQMPNGATLNSYNSSTTGEYSIHINFGSMKYKIRITP